MLDLGRELAVPVLQIDLANGFFRDRVRVELNGRTVLDREDVTTRTQIGLAAHSYTEVEAGRSKLEVVLPERGLRESFPIEVSGPTYLEISITPDGRISSRSSPEPFRRA